MKREIMEKAIREKVKEIIQKNTSLRNATKIEVIIIDNNQDKKTGS